MGNILIKEFKLSAHILTFLFIGFGFMFFFPGYPILCAVFFVTLGIFQSFQRVRENNDILFSCLLPIAKCDIVKAKYVFVNVIELSALLLMGAAVAIRMTFLKDAPVYLNNALMNANGFSLGVAFFIFGLFNRIFVGGFFKTAYNFGKPFVCYIAAAFITIFVCEALHYFPHLEILNAFGAEHCILQISLFVSGVISYVLLTLNSYHVSCRRFEKIDL